MSTLERHCAVWFSLQPEPVPEKKRKHKKSREDTNRSKEEMSRGKPDKSGRQYEKTENMKKRENQI